MHKLLQHQLKKTGAIVDKKFLNLVNQAYEDADEDRVLLEHSLDISSEEMRELYKQLKITSKHEIKESKDRYDALVYELRDHYFFYAFNKNYLLTYLSDSIYNIAGFTKEEMLHTSFTGYLSNDRLNKDILKYVKKVISQVMQDSHKVSMYHKDGSLLYLEVNNYPIFDEENNLIEVKGIARNITKEYEAQKKLHYISTHDRLTGIANRHSLYTKLEYIIADSERNSKSFALMYLDLDNFKEVNDTLGHYGGDALLKELVQIIKGEIRNNDIFARIGGDEFIIILTDIDSHFISKIAQNILTALAPNISVSIGIAIYPKDGEDIDTLLKNSDSAMYKIKNSGKNNFSHFSLSS